MHRRSTSDTPTGEEAHLRDMAKLPDARIEFTEPMLAESVSKLPEGNQWQYEIKLDGYRALALKAQEGVLLLSRRNNVLNSQFADKGLRSRFASASPCTSVRKH